MTFLGRDGEKDFLEVTELGRERRNHICQSDLPSWESTTTQRPFEGVCVYGGSDAPSGKGGWSQRPYLPRKGMHPSFLPSSRRVKSCLPSLSCLASLASGGRAPRGHFWEDPSSIPSYLPFLIAQSKGLLPPLLHRSLHRWLLCLHMVHPLERGLWLSPGPPPSLQEVFPDGVPLRC